MQQHNALRGVGVAMVTPFLNDARRSIDYPGTERIIEHLIAGSIDYIVLLGSTGEAATIDATEQQEFVHFAVRAIKGRCPVVLGCSSNNTSALVHTLQSLDCTGIDYILSATPSYNKPSQKGLLQHYAAVAAASPRPVILYNVPGRTGVNMLAETTCTIAREQPNVVAIKEASGDIHQVARILRDRPQGFIVLSGDDGLTLPMIALGAEGVISVIGNVVPHPFTDLVHLALDGRTAEAAAIHMRLIPLFERLFTHGNPAGIKAAMSCLDLCNDTLRPPLTEVPVSFISMLQEAIQEALE